MNRQIVAFAAILMAITMILSCENTISESESSELNPNREQPESQMLNPANQSDKNFQAHLDGDSENPVVETKAQGQAKIQLSKDGNSFTFKLIAANIENITQAHIHCGAADVNGPVVVFLYPDSPPASEIPGRFDGVLAEGERTNDDVIVRPDSDACPGGVANFEELIEKIRNGEAYVNVHTTQYPAGEIRGQLR